MDGSAAFQFINIFMEVGPRVVVGSDVCKGSKELVVMVAVCCNHMSEMARVSHAPGVE